MCAAALRFITRVRRGWNHISLLDGEMPLPLTHASTFANLTYTRTSRLRDRTLMHLAAGTLCTSYGIKRTTILSFLVIEQRRLTLSEEDLLDIKL